MTDYTKKLKRINRIRNLTWLLSAIVIFLILLDLALIRLFTNQSYINVNTNNINITLFAFLFIIISTLLIASLIIVFYLIRKINTLHVLINIGNDMKIGNLNVNANIRPYDELGELTGIMFDLASNFQEVLLLTGSYSNDILNNLKKLENSVNKTPGTKNNKEINKNLKDINKDLKNLQSIVEDFKYYKVEYQTDKITGKD